MVAYIRCPYCGHPEVEPTALYCPACDGEIQGESSSTGSVDTPALGSLSSSTAGLDLEDLLSLTSDPADTNDVLNLSAKAPTLDQLQGVSDQSGWLDAGNKAMDVSLDRSAQVRTPRQVQNTTQAKPKDPASWGVHAYLVLLGLCIAGLVLVAEVPRQSDHVDIPSASENVTIGIKALQEERYAAAIKYLEQVTQNNKNRHLLPSLALAYSKTSQLERSREVMKAYRKGMPGQEKKVEEGSP